MLRLSPTARLRAPRRSDPWLPAMLWVFAYLFTGGFVPGLIAGDAADAGDPLPLPIKPLVLPRVAVLEFDLNDRETEPAKIRGLPRLAATLLRSDLFRVPALSVYPEAAARKPADPALAARWTAAKALPDANVTIGGALAPDPDNAGHYILKLRLYQAGRNPLIFTYPNNPIEEMPGVIHEAVGELLEELDIEPPPGWKARPLLPGKLMLPLASAFEALSKIAVTDPLSSIAATIAAYEEGYKPVLAGEGAKLGLIYLEMARHHPSPAAALEQLETAVKLDPGLSEAYFLLARNHLDAGEASEALDACQSGLKAHPHFAELMMEEGRAYSQLADEHPANRIEYLTSAGTVTVEALKRRPHSDLAWNDMGACEYDRGPAHRSRAEACYLKAYEINPLNRNALQNLTYFYAEQASFEKVRKFGQEALAVHPTDEEIAIEVARAQFALGDFAAAVKHWQQAIDNGYIGKRMPAYLGLCNALWAAGDDAQAEAVIAAFLDRAKQEAEDSFELARLQASRAAIEQRWIKLRTDQKTAAFTQALALMRTLLQNQRYDTARKQIEIAFALADLPELYDTYIMLLEASGEDADHQTAQKLCAQWRKEFPQDPRALFRQALIDQRDNAWGPCGDHAAAGLKLLPPLVTDDPQKLYPLTMETHAGLNILAARAAAQSHPRIPGEADTTNVKAARASALAHLDAGLKVLIPDCPLARDIQRMKIALQAPPAP